jgi:lipid II:glycine glycyltransferase (peptidoglycan interpeptide bridge formation enzyme)
MSQSILQTPAWADFQRALGKTVLEREGEGWSYLAIVEQSPFGRSLYCPYGPAADDAGAFAAALADLTAQARLHKAHYVRVEPVAVPLGTEPSRKLRSLGLTRAPRDIQPRHTWVIDLQQEEKDLLGAMRSSNRNIYRNIHKKGVSIETSVDPADIGILLGFLGQTADRSGFTSHTDSYLATAARTLMPAGAAKLYYATLEGTGPIAAALSYDTGTSRAYAHAAIDEGHKKLSAGIPLLVRMILDARAEGKQTFDLWGIAPADEPDHEWAGFTKFKQSFGGYAVDYPGTWDLPVSKPQYKAYQLARAARGKLLPAAKQARGKVAPVVRPVVQQVRRTVRGRFGQR